MNKVTRRRYTPEFKAEAVALVEEQGYKVANAARALGIDRKKLDRWLAKARAQPASGPAADSRDAELARLREEVRKLRIETEILKNLRAAATAARSTLSKTAVKERQLLTMQQTLVGARWLPVQGQPKTPIAGGSLLSPERVPGRFPQTRWLTPGCGPLPECVAAPPP